MFALALAPLHVVILGQLPICIDFAWIVVFGSDFKHVQRYGSFGTIMYGGCCAPMGGCKIRCTQFVHSRCPNTTWKQGFLHNHTLGKPRFVCCSELRNGVHTKHIVVDVQWHVLINYNIYKIRTSLVQEGIMYSCGHSLSQQCDTLKELTITSLFYSCYKYKIIHWLYHVYKIYLNVW